MPKLTCDVPKVVPNILKVFSFPKSQAKWIVTVKVKTPEAGDCYACSRHGVLSERNSPDDWEQIILKEVYPDH